MTLKAEYVIERFRSVHGNKYDYSKVVYVTNKTPITVICPEHGEFQTIPSNHYYLKTGCKLCGDKLKGPGNGREKQHVE